MGCNDCAPFLFEEEFQRIRDFICNLENPDPGQELGCFDVAVSGRMDIDENYTTLVEYFVPVDYCAALVGIEVNVIGFATEFKVEFTPDGATWQFLRSFVCNVQSPNAGRQYKTPVAVREKTSSVSRFRIQAKMLGGSCENLQGSAFASMNGLLKLNT